VFAWLASAGDRAARLKSGRTVCPKNWDGGAKTREFFDNPAVAPKSWIVLDKKTSNQYLKILVPHEQKHQLGRNRPPFGPLSEAAGVRAQLFQETGIMSKDVVGSVMVVGGGIAGMQSALDLADSGYYVHLVEKSPSIGGAMAQLDKTFPTNDCAM
jgi:heterodisulfide reductase subunit A